MRFKGLDLNLLVAMDVLLDEQSVSRAAERMNVSQPAMSAALTRIREYFADPILQLHGKRMIPTAHAIRLQPRLKELLRDLDVLISESSQFDPTKSERRFRIGTSDYLLAVLFPSVTQEIERTAPGIRIETIQPSDSMSSTLDQGFLDLIISPEYMLSSDHPTELLFEEDYVVVGWSKNPAFRRRKLTQEDFFKAGHVAVELGRVRRTSFAEAHLQEMPRERRIDMNVSSFLVAPEMVVNSMRLTVMQRRLALLFAERLDIAMSEMPFPFPKMQEMIQYHTTRENDPGLRWLTDLIKRHATPSNKKK
ncbi:MAG: LysR family transcriptional regulator [Parvularcula sp.]|uniref:LysR family transcriptional regulator n=1 Tax=Hyphococcus sp. TaxID=2038636 RepID=UPI000C6423AD|nr:LysR family transcriptional regulator [Parvularcula sp.]